MMLMGKSSTTRDDLLDVLLERSSAASFYDFVTLADGMHPSELFQRLIDYAGSDVLLQERARALVTEAKIPVSGEGHPQGASLALPHPLDAEWRFTDATAEHLLKISIQATSPGNSILLMGVPSVVLAALRSDYDRRFVVLGESNIITDGLRKITAQDNRFAHDSDQDYDVSAAVLDPPWYLDQFLGMLGEASSRCLIGGHIIGSAPSEGVRPSIREDLGLVQEAAARCGLTQISREVGVLAYRTPLFELNALRASGIGAWLPNWRRGNLIVYQKDTEGVCLHQAPLNCSGFEVTLSGIRLRLLGPGRTDATSELMPIYEGEIFPSVSMRAPRRKEASLWTSGNRAFSVAYPACLTALAAIAEERQLLPKGLAPGLLLPRNSEPVDVVEPLIQKLIDLADREFAEAATVLGPTAWETAANDARFLNGSRSVLR
jgi:hypothetical protein